MQTVESDQNKTNSPKQIEGIELLEKISESWMGAAYRARQRALDRIVVVRFLGEQFCRNEAFVARFQQEAHDAGRLRHPNIAAVYDSGEVDGVHYLITEFVEGESVSSRLGREQTLPENAAVGLCHDVAEAMRYAWDEARLLHGDLKPDKLVVERSTQRVRITDFGLAKSARLRQGDASFGLGSPYYAAPEKALGRDEVDCRADMYALGITLYQMLTGRLPFQELPVEQVLAKQVDGRLPDPRESRPDLSPALMAVLERMLAKDPGNRYPNWAVLAHDLRQVQEGRSPAMPPLAPMLSTMERIAPRAPTAKSGHPQLLVGISAAVLLTLTTAAVVIGYFLFRSPSDERPEKAGAPAQTNAVAAAEPVTPEEPAPDADQAVAQGTVPADGAASARANEEQEAKLAAQAAHDAEAKTRYDAWRPSFEALLAAHDFERALQHVAQAQQAPEFAPVQSSLAGDESLVRLLASFQQTAWSNFVGQTHTVGAAAGVVTRVEADKFWVKLSAGEVAVPKTNVGVPHICALGLATGPTDPQAQLAAGMFAWYGGEKKLAQTYLAAATRGGATADFPLPPGLPLAEEPPAPTLGALRSPVAEAGPATPASPGTGSVDAAATAIRQPAQIDVVVKKGLKRGFSGTDYDNQRDVLSFSVSVKNKEFQKEYTNLTAALYVYGRSTTTAYYQLLLKHTSKAFDLPKGKSYEFEGGTISLDYDENYTAKFGVKYAGYVLVVRDESGNVLKAKAMNQSFVTKLEKLDQIQVKAYFDGALTVPGSSSGSGGTEGTAR